MTEITFLSRRYVLFILTFSSANLSGFSAG